MLIHYYDPQRQHLHWRPETFVIWSGGAEQPHLLCGAGSIPVQHLATGKHPAWPTERNGRRSNGSSEEAQCMEFLEKLPQGIHSMAGDAGKMLSGGQRQRISLGAGDLKGCSIVVLDEATAYADQRTKKRWRPLLQSL
ncbi:MAG: ATP-binding cassette domain-containing protein [Eubacteriales bacterium]